MWKGNFNNNTEYKTHKDFCYLLQRTQMFLKQKQKKPRMEYFVFLIGMST